MVNLKSEKWILFKNNKRAYLALCLFIILFVLSLFAEFIANDKPIIASYKGQIYFPIIKSVTDTDLGGSFIKAADFNDPFIKSSIKEHGWALMPPIRYNHKTISFKLKGSIPSPPGGTHILGTDDQGRDVLARLIYGFRTSVLFALILTIISSIIGVSLGAIQGYFGGKIDFFMQRVIEIWTYMPSLFIIIIIASIYEASFFLLLGVMLLFSWTALVGMVRAEFLKARNIEYVTAAKVLGVKQRNIIFKHMLPNALTASVTYVPYLLSAAVTTLTSLDYLGLGLPAGSASLGEMLLQSKNNLHAPWIGISVITTVTTLLMLMIFIGEGLRDALDPRK